MASQYQLDPDMVLKYSDDRAITWDRFVTLYTMAVTNRGNMLQITDVVTYLVVNRYLEDLIRSAAPVGIVAKF